MQFPSCANPTAPWQAQQPTPVAGISEGSTPSTLQVQIPNENGSFTSIEIPASAIAGIVAAQVKQQQQQQQQLQQQQQRHGRASSDGNEVGERSRQTGCTW